MPKRVKTSLLKTGPKAGIYPGTQKITLHVIIQKIKTLNNIIYNRKA
jgi:hypothetical protein